MPIRPAVEADAAGIALVHVRSWQAAYRGLMPQEYLDGLDLEQRRATWECWLGQADWSKMGFFVAEEDDSVIGFAGFSPTRDEDGDPATTAELSLGGELVTLTGEGNGPISAFVSGLRDALGVELDVVGYSEHAVTSGAGSHTGPKLSCPLSGTLDAVEINREVWGSR